MRRAAKTPTMASGDVDSRLPSEVEACQDDRSAIALPAANLLRKDPRGNLSAFAKAICSVDLGLLGFGKGDLPSSAEAFCWEE